MKEGKLSDCVEDARHYFRHADRSKRLNCAQSVLKAFQRICDIEDDTIDEYSAYGHGRSPEGVCGAIYAAANILKDRGVGEGEIERYFIDIAGSTRCKEIRRNRTLSCEQCVENAVLCVARALDGRA